MPKQNPGGLVLFLHILSFFNLFIMYNKQTSEIMNKLSIIFQLEKEVFYLFSFLNQIGYNYKNNPRGMHPLRKFIRQELKDVLKVNRYSLLKDYLSKKHQGQFVQWLLRKKYATEALTNIYSKRDLFFFQKFDKLFQKFVNGEKKILPWSEAKKFYIIEKKNHYRKIVKELHSLIKGLNVDFNLLDLNKVVIVPNFLDAYNWGYGPKIGKMAFIVYGPLRNGDFRLITHEFLHSVVHPLLSNNEIFLRRIKELFKDTPPKAQLKKKGYDDWAVIIEEYLVRAINIKSQNLGLKEKRKLLKQEEKKGFKYIKRIYLKLKRNYKRNEIVDILKNILDNIEKFVPSQ